MTIASSIIGQVGEGARKRNIRRHIETGATNTLLTSVVAPGKNCRVLAVLVAYSGAATQAGVTSTLNSGAGSGYDNVLNTGSANARYTQYLPTVPPILAADDSLDVAAPAGGSGVTASVLVITEDLEHYGA